jgi:hypothetical protein
MDTPKYYCPKLNFINMTDEQMRYPVGKFVAPVSYIPEDKRKWISEIRNLPGKVRNAIMPLNDRQLDTQYRTGGWTLKAGCAPSGR